MRRLLALAVCLLPTAALAQLDLSGATAPAPAGTVVTPKAAPSKPKPRVPRAAASISGAAEASLAGKTLALDGGKSQITFVAHDKSVDISRLTLSGHKVSNGRDECHVDVGGVPLALTPLAKMNGATRFSVAVTGCPLTLEVLNGAVLTSADEAVCTFQSADCQAPAVGLWGPSAGDIGPDQVKTIERERTAADRSVREAYKGLTLSTKDRSVIRGYASDQAGFSSLREETCRDYIGESRHGFCASRLTQARATMLEAELSVAETAKEARKKKHADGGRARP